MTADLDLAYLREHPENLERLVEHQRIRTTPLPGGDTCRSERLTLDDGTDLFTKQLDGAPAGFFEAEAAGLRWLAEAGPDALQVPEVLVAGPARLVLGWTPSAPGEPSSADVERFGRALARTHRAGAEAYGAPWQGFVSRLPVDNRPASAPGWPAFFVERRLEPVVRAAVDAGRLARTDADAITRVIARVEQLAGPDEAPARVHGDLWWGNVIITADGTPYVVDPSAHGGHRETDLAMLALFGAPHLDRLVAAYEEIAPLADGWADRQALHQLHPLLVHAAHFGGSYGPRAGDLARRLG